MVLPVPVRERLGLKAGMHLNVILAADENGDGADTIILQPLTPRLIRELRGSVKCAARRSTTSKRNASAIESADDEALRPRRECPADLFRRSPAQARAKPSAGVAAPASPLLMSAAIGAK